MNSKKFLLYIFGIIFIWGGFISIGAEIYNIYTLKSARFTKHVTTDVISLKAGERWVTYANANNITDNAKYWYTEEVVFIDNKKLTFYGKYLNAPSPSIEHTIISNDGISWKINDTNITSSLLGSFIGVFCITIGIVTVLFTKRYG